jgi:hypothetical protein
MPPRGATKGDPNAIHCRKSRRGGIAHRMRRLVEMAESQKNDIPVLVALPCRLHVDAPGAGAPSGDTIEW